ncbi:Ribonuclease II, chloroplastic/mitochondrial [Porphyridium purpureum]|uniref:Ribonuclease II, chloroplastic/mitochondrial n=1 Tax=Porphyridium purpureum TaxID=35688 RepID=A0A5J4YRA8_PORPP|nr:Ribonuclease II, chloroplastic/mitochondrial [Porphyridium purpureum]|eukprot:POR2274..scf229_5
MHACASCRSDVASSVAEVVEPGCVVMARVRDAYVVGVVMSVVVPPPQQERHFRMAVFRREDRAWKTVMNVDLDCVRFVWPRREARLANAKAGGHAPPPTHRFSVADFLGVNHAHPQEGASMYKDDVGMNSGERAAVQNGAQEVRQSSLQAKFRLPSANDGSAYRKSISETSSTKSLLSKEYFAIDAALSCAAEVVVQSSRTTWHSMLDLCLTLEEKAIMSAASAESDSVALDILVYAYHSWFHAAQVSADSVEGSVPAPRELDALARQTNIFASALLVFSREADLTVSMVRSKVEKGVLLKAHSAAAFHDKRELDTALLKLAALCRPPGWTGYAFVSRVQGVLAIERRVTDFCGPPELDDIRHLLLARLYLAVRGIAATSLGAYCFCITTGLLRPRENIVLKMSERFGRAQENSGENSSCASVRIEEKVRDLIRDENASTQEAISKRADFRFMRAFAIDSKETTEVDDAISIEYEPYVGEPIDDLVVEHCARASTSSSEEKACTQDHNSRYWFAFDQAMIRECNQPRRDVSPGATAHGLRVKRLWIHIADPLEYLLLASCGPTGRQLSAIVESQALNIVDSLADRLTQSFHDFSKHAQAEDSMEDAEKEAETLPDGGLVTSRWEHADCLKDTDELLSQALHRGVSLYGPTSAERVDMFSGGIGRNIFSLDANLKGDSTAFAVSIGFSLTDSGHLDSRSVVVCESVIAVERLSFERLDEELEPLPRNDSCELALLSKFAAVMAHARQSLKKGNKITFVPERNGYRRTMIVSPPLPFCPHAMQVSQRLAQRHFKTPECDGSDGDGEDDEKAEKVKSLSLALDIDCDCSSLVSVPDRDDVGIQRVVKEYMIACGVALGYYGRARRLMLPFRSQVMLPEDKEKFIEQTPNDELQFERFISSLVPASIEFGNPMPHHSLNVSAYVQASSPIRRSLDLVAHLVLKVHLQRIQLCLEGEEKHAGSLSGREDDSTSILDAHLGQSYVKAGLRCAATDVDATLDALHRTVRASRRAAYLRHAQFRCLQWLHASSLQDIYARGHSGSDSTLPRKADKFLPFLTIQKELHTDAVREMRMIVNCSTRYWTLEMVRRSLLGLLGDLSKKQRASENGAPGLTYLGTIIRYKTWSLAEIADRGENYGLLAMFENADGIVDRVGMSKRIAGFEVSVPRLGMRLFGVLAGRTLEADNKGKARLAKHAQDGYAPGAIVQILIRGPVSPAGNRIEHVEIARLVEAASAEERKSLSAFLTSQ